MFFQFLIKQLLNFSIQFIEYVYQSLNDELLYFFQEFTNDHQYQKLFIIYSLIGLRGYVFYFIFFFLSLNYFHSCPMFNFYIEYLHFFYFFKKHPIDLMSIISSNHFDLIFMNLALFMKCSLFIDHSIFGYPFIIGFNFYYFFYQYFLNYFIK